MKAIWTGLFLLGFVLSVGCSIIRTPNAFATTTPSAGSLSIVSDTRSAIDEQTATRTLPMGLGTLRAFRTGFAETRTRAPTLTITPTSTPTPTCRPLPEWLTPGETFLARPNKTVTDTLAALMLQTYNSKFEAGYELPAFAVIDDPFQIEIINGAIDPSWATTEVITNTDKTLGVFFTYVPEPSSGDETERLAWFVTRRKMWIKDFGTDAVYRVKWDDLPYRPIDVEGWPTQSIFVFSHFGNPWHGFLIAIDARQKKVLLTLQLEYWC